MKQRSVLLSTLIAAALGTAYAGDKADGSAASADKGHPAMSIQASPTSEVDKQKEAYPTGAAQAPLSGSGTSSAGTPSSAGATSDTMHTPPSAAADAPTSGVGAQKEAYPGRAQPSDGSGASASGTTSGSGSMGASGAASVSTPAVGGSSSTSVTGSTSSSGTAAALGATTSATPLSRASVQAEGTAAMQEGLFPHGDPLLTDDRPKGGPIGADDPMNLRGAVSAPRKGTSDQVD